MRFRAKSNKTGNRKSLTNHSSDSGLEDGAERLPYTTAEHDKAE